MPVHNGARFLREAMVSVLSQTYVDLELLVVDDDSSDASVLIARGFTDRRVRCLSGHGRRGLAGTLNLGLEAAAGEYVARLDQDDVSHPDRIAKQVAWLDGHSDVALVGGLARLIDEEGRRIGVVRRPVSRVGIRWYSLLENPLIHSTAMFRLAVVRSLGGYDDALPLAEDFDLWGRILQTHQVDNLDEPLVDYRSWSASMMSSVETDTDGSRQQQLRQIMSRLIERHVTFECGAGAYQVGQGALLAAFTLGVQTERAHGFLEALTTLRRRFEAKWPEAADVTDYWRTVARQYDAIAFRLSPPSRTAAAGVYAHACRHAPRAAVRLSWPRIGSLVLLGRAGRRGAARVLRGSR